MATHTYIKIGEGEDYNYSQDHCFIKVPSSTNNEELCLVEDTLKPGFNLPRHHHKKMFEVFYILEGEVEYTFDDSVIIAKAGDTITVPPEVWHAAYSEKGARMLTIFNRGRFDEYLKRLSTMSQDEFTDFDFMNQVAEEYDIYER